MSKKEETKKTTINAKKAKDFGEKAYKLVTTFICEIVLATFAIIGVMSLVHTEKHVQTIIAVLFIAALFAVKFNNKK